VQVIGQDLGWKPGCFWSRLTATMSKDTGARWRSVSRISKRLSLSFPPERQTITLSPWSIAPKSPIACPTADQSFLELDVLARRPVGTRVGGCVGSVMPHP
jgi:hypothetical protein